MYIHTYAHRMLALKAAIAAKKKGAYMSIYIHTHTTRYVHTHIHTRTECCSESGNRSEEEGCCEYYE